MVLLLDGRELVFGSSLADQGILADSTFSCYWKEVTLERRSIQPRTIADVGECQRLDHFLGEWGHVTVECWLTSVLSSITFV